MPLSKESRNLGQKAAAISLTAFAIKSLGIGAEQANAPAFFQLVGAENAAAVAGVASLAVTAYFLMRVWDERLAASYRRLVNTGTTVVQEIPGDGTDLDTNLLLQGAVKNTIGFADFWLPLGLAVIVAVLMAGDMANLAKDWSQHLLN